MIQKAVSFFQASLAIAEALLSRFRREIDLVSERIYSYLEDNMRYLLVVSLITSICFGVAKTLLFNGFNVDSYQYYALSLERWLSTGTEDYLFNHYYARQRIFFPLLVAIVHHVIPIDITLLTCAVNLIFAVGSIFMMRELARYHGYTTFEVDLSTLIVVLSYNFVNSWFNVLTDMAGLFFFLLALCFVELYLRDSGYTCLLLSIGALGCSILCRELYVVGAILYIWIVQSRTLRFRAFATFGYLGLMVFLFFREALPFGHVIPLLYWPLFERGDYVGLFIKMQVRWLDVEYVIVVLKGLVKVGIIPALSILLVINLNKWELSLAWLKKNIPRLNVIGFWAVVFFLTYSIFYSNIYSASGLRYLLPISWIPLMYAAKELTRKVDYKTVKVIAILFLTIYPLAWSAGELYVNRNAPSGAGSLLYQNFYSNEMNELSTLIMANDTYIDVEILNGSYLIATSLPSAYNLTNEGGVYAYFGILMWLNVTETAIIRVRLKSPNDGDFGIGVHKANLDYSPGWGEQVFIETCINATMEFVVYEFRIDTPFLLRYIQLGVGGGPNKQVVFDYLTVMTY